MPTSSLDPVLAKLSYELIEMLRSLRTEDAQERSFKQVAALFGRDERTVSRQLREIDDAFWSTQHTHLLERPAGHKNYRLTTAGQVFVDLLEPITEAMLAAVGEAASAARRLQVLCTSNCLPHLRRLNDALPRERGFEVVPVMQRTAEIDLDSLGDRSAQRICLLSTVMSAAQHPVVGKVVQWNDHVEVIPLEVNRFRMLAVEDLGFLRPVTVKEVIDSGVTFLTPNGGPVFAFLDRNYPDWRRLRPFQHVEVPDLDGGVRCLASRLVRRSAMVVHGIEVGSSRLKALDEPPQFYDFVSGAHELLAVTGIFRIRRDFDQGADAHPSDIVWRTARSLWSTVKEEAA